MVKIYSEENSIVIEDEKNNSTVQFYFEFEPIITFNKDFNYTYQEEMKLRRKSIVIEINREEDNDLYALLSSILNDDSSFDFASDSPMGHYTKIEHPGVMRLSNENGKIKIVLLGGRSEASNNVFLNPSLTDLTVFYAFIDTLAKQLNILSSAENRKLMYTYYNRMFGDESEN